MATVKSVLNAPDYAVADRSDRQPDDTLYPANREGLVLRLFGTLPDYRDPKIAALWTEIGQRDRFEVWDDCRRNGVEVLDESGEPVDGWRDIAVLLEARARRLIS